MFISPSQHDLEMSIEGALGGISFAIEKLEWAVGIYTRDFAPTLLHSRLRRRLVGSKSSLKGILTGLGNVLGTIREVAPTEIIPTEEASSCPVPSLQEAQP